MCRDGCDVVVVVSDYRLCSLLHLIKIIRNDAALHIERCFLAVLIIECVLYSWTMVLHMQIKADVQGEVDSSYRYCVFSCKWLRIAHV